MSEATQPDEEPPAIAAKGPASIPERVAEFFNRLHRQPPSRSADDALERITLTMDSVEDDLSGLVKQIPPPARGDRGGRMYPPSGPGVTRHPDGSITAKTKGQIFEFGKDGGIKIIRRDNGDIIFEQPGAGN